MTNARIVAVAAISIFAAGLDAVVMPKEIQTIETVSTVDGFRQKAYWYAPPGTDAGRPVPLLVFLHPWSFTYEMASPRSAELAIEKGWALICPNFRGPNKTPDACGSDKVVQDILDAVAEAKCRARIDEKRIYLLGASGGGYLALLMAGRAPEVWAGVSAWCPISDLARWHADSIVRKNRYAQMMSAACGGTPEEKPEEYRRRSPLAHLAAARAAGVHVDVATGIHDGHAGSVPVGHAIRAFNVLADEKDRISEQEIASIESSQAVPAHLAPSEKTDPWYGKRHSSIHLRRMSANARLTLFEGAHNCCIEAAVAWLGEQRLGADVKWKMPAQTPAQDTAAATEVAK